MLKRIWKTIWKDAIGYVVALIILFIPFLQIYIPIFSSSAGFSYRTCAYYLIDAIDVINVTEQNLMLGWFMKFLGLSSRGYTMEANVGFSIVLLTTFLILYVKLRKDRAVVGAKVTDCNSSGCPLYESGIQILTLVEVPDGCAYCVSG